MDSISYRLAIALPVIFLSMAIHELMHAWASDRLGDDTARLQGRISLNPIKHIDPFLTLAMPLLLILSGSPIIFGAAKPVQVNFARLRHGEYGGAVVGMIGPLTNLLLAILAAATLHLIPSPNNLVADILVMAVAVNVGFFVFNSIPWPPLDGSRLLYAFAPERLQKIMESIESQGMTGLIIFIFLFYSFGGGVSNIIEKITNSLLFF